MGALAALHHAEPGPAWGGVALERAAGIEVGWARHQDEVREAQRLRHAVFAGELGARLPVDPVAGPGHDADRFDDFCEHLVVRSALGAVIGTYRVLTPDAARRAGGLYTETEFDIASLAPLRGRMVELGRSCVHPEWRTGGVILALWGALAQFMHRHALQTMVGCASVGLRDGGSYAASLWMRLRQAHLADAALLVKPHLALPVDQLDHGLDVDPPPLVKGYLRCGARLIGAPAWDPDFGCADLPVLLRLEDMPARYRRHFLGN